MFCAGHTAGRQCVSAYCIRRETAPLRTVLFVRRGAVVVCNMSRRKQEEKLNALISGAGIERIQPPCGYFGRCGGCAYQDIAYEDQLKIKAAQVVSLLSEKAGKPEMEKDIAAFVQSLLPEEQGGIQTKHAASLKSENAKNTHSLFPDEKAQGAPGTLSDEKVKKTAAQSGSWVFEGIDRSPDIYGYRNKMEFSFGDEMKGGPLALGLHKKRSFYDIVNIRKCLICPDDMNLIRNTVLDYFAPLYAQGQIDYVNTKSHAGYLRHLLLRRACNTGEILIGLVTSTPQKSVKLDASKEEELINGLVVKLLSLEAELDGTIAGICHIYNDSLSDVVQSDAVKILYGRDYIYEEICSLRFKVSIFSFFQTNSKGAQILYETARSWAKELSAAKEGEVRCAEGGRAAPEALCLQKPVIFDLYSGTGTIAQLMSPAASKVIGIEIVEEAVEAARENAALNGIENVRFISGDVLKILCGSEGDSLAEPDIIILDPPREGVHPKALGRILGYGCENIIYISCKIQSLADELEAFANAGYFPVKARCIDMFPNAKPQETVCLLGKLKT